jgi:RHS repeat-associated protein
MMHGKLDRRTRSLPCLAALFMSIAGGPAGTASAAIVAGRTPTAFDVSATGAATYRVPIWTPQGIGDVQLDLALEYSSRSDNGVVGIGWSIGGLSTITRCNRTVAQDGHALGISLTLSDRFCYRGGQLKLVSGTYGQAGSVYATEVESFSRIEAIGTAGNGPASFRVTTKNGLVYEYGLSADARQTPGGGATVRTWALSRIRDRCVAPACSGTTGNRIDLTYTNDAANNTLRISSIAYPVTASGQGPFYEVLFGFEPRPVNDIPNSTSAGYKSREPNRLKNITIRPHGSSTPTKWYDLVYDQSPTTLRSRLRSIQECSAANCLPVTTISYQNGAAGWSGTLTSTGITASGASGVGVMPIDLNGDGLTDLVYPKSATSSTSRWWAMLATTTGFRLPIDTGVVTANADRELAGAFSGSGQQQLLMRVGGAWTVVQYNTTGAFSTSSTGVTTTGEFAAIDYDGDGLPDLASVVGNEIRVRRNTTVPPGAVTFAATAETVTTFVAGANWSIWLGSATSIRDADFNGDGRGDLQFISTKTSGRGDTELRLHSVRSNGFGAPATQIVTFISQGPSIAADWNGNGCTDYSLPGSVSIPNCGDGAGPGTGVSLGVSTQSRFFADWDGDGRHDFVYLDTSRNTWVVMRSTGDGVQPAISTGTPAPAGTTWFVFDRDGDGLTDLGYRDSGGQIRYRLHNGATVPADLAISFVDGNGLSQAISYKAISRSNYAKYTTATFPEQDYQGPLYVVGAVTLTDGSGGTYQQTFQYSGAVFEAQGRGFEGFQARRVLDSRNGLYSYDYFGQTFPHTGVLRGQTLSSGLGSADILKWSGVPASQVSGGAGFERRYFPYLSTQEQTQYQLGGHNPGGLTLQRAIAFTYGDGFGNPTRIVTSTTDKDPGSPFYNSTWQTTVDTTFQNDTASHCLGLPTAMSITGVVPGETAETRRFSHANNTTLCRVRQQVIEPDNPALKVTSTVTFDSSCGNVQTVQVTGSKPDGTAMPARTTSLDFGSRCQLPEGITNALNQRTQLGYHYDFGTVRSVADPNGFLTEWTIDDFGRRTREDRPDGTATVWTYAGCTTPPCWGAADHRLLLTEDSRDTANKSINTRELVYDGMGRLRSHRTNRVLGAWTVIDFGYDPLGRLNTQSQPYSAIANQNGFFDWDYDALGRVTAAKLLRGPGDAHRTTTFSYDGRTTSVVDDKSRETRYVHDVTGHLRSVIDPAPGGTTRYAYDAFGNLNRIIDPASNVTTFRYNLRGFKTATTDADRGTWSFTPNSLNELVSWTNANGRTSSMEFDALGRMTRRYDDGQLSEFIWGNSAAAGNVGRLQSMAGGGYSEVLTYDGAGRLSRRSITTDQVYRFDFAYDAQGLLSHVTYPASPIPSDESASRFKVGYDYSYGRLYRLRDITQAGREKTLWQLTAANAYESPVSEALSAGAISVASSYSPWTNWLTGSTAGVGGVSANRQNLAFDWDSVGNLSQRRDLTQALTESFQYDDLDRIDLAFRNGILTLDVDYDPSGSGNITRMSDVGAYKYGDPAKPHAVTAAGTNYTFSYDANGNVRTRNGLAQTWTSFDLPATLQATIDGSTYSSQFTYGPDHQRWRQVATYSNGTETTHYVGGLLEKTNARGMTMWRHYVTTPSGLTAIVSRNSDGSKTVTYALGDHLGSSDTLLDESGNFITRVSFDSFGARRGSDWLPTTPPDWVGIAETTRRGFTSHEMLDNVGLVHMNGRVYDPYVGRFLSVDPLIGSTAESQSVNPYAYLGNRPLNGADPSGLCLDCGIGIVIGIAFDFGSMFGGHRLPPPPARAGTSAQTSVTVCDPGMSSPSCGAAGAAGFSKSLVLGRILESSPGAPVGPCAECNQGNVGDFIVGILTGAVDSASYSIVHLLVNGVAFATYDPFLHGKADQIARYISIGPPDSSLGELGYDLGPILPIPGIGGAAAWALRGDKLIARAQVVLGEQVGARAAGAATETSRALSTIRYTQPGEKFYRYESANPVFSRITSGGGVTRGTFAAPASDGFVPVGQRAARYNLPRPEIPRPRSVLLEPHAGTPVIGPRTVSGGTGNEVIFPLGF